MNVKQLCTLCAALLVSAVLAVPGVAGRGGGYGGGRGMRGPGGPGGGGGRRGAPALGGPRAGGARAAGRAHDYNPAFESAFSGTVVSEQMRGRGEGLGSEIAVRLENGQLRRVRLAPPWYLDDIGLAPKAGDRVEIIGAPSQAGARGETIARELVWNGRTYRLRMQQGVPLWAGARSSSWSRYPGLWDSTRTQEVTGEVEAVQDFSPGGAGMGRGVMLRLKTRDRARVRVQLGPAWYVQEHLSGLKPGDEVTVKGSEVGRAAEQEMIASEIIRGQDRLRLRNAEGRPEWAGGWQNWEGWGGGTRYGSLYNPSALRTITGVVETAAPGSPMSGFGPGAMWTVRTREGEQVRMHLGPVWFMEQSGLSLAPGEEATVTGSEVELGGKRVLMVSDLEAGGRRLVLRDKDGTPVWFGRPMTPP